MESEILEEQIEWEARRVATAFRTEAFTHHSHNFVTTDFYAESKTKEIRWTLDMRQENSFLRLLEIKQNGKRCRIVLVDAGWGLWSHGESHEEMARGLYRLGFEDEGVLSQLPVLTAHEKLELRLSMPREFWPQKWLEEENAANPASF